MVGRLFSFLPLDKRSPTKEAEYKAFFLLVSRLFFHSCHWIRYHQLQKLNIKHALFLLVGGFFSLLWLNKGAQTTEAKYSSLSSYVLVGGFFYLLWLYHCTYKRAPTTEAKYKTCFFLFDNGIFGIPVVGKEIQLQTLNVACPNAQPRTQNYFMKPSGLSWMGDAVQIILNNFLDSLSIYWWAWITVP